MNQLATVETARSLTLSSPDTETLVTLFVGKQLFGLPVLKVRDILMPREVFPIPLAPSEVAGSINLRGRIVTVIDMRLRLGMPALATDGEDERFCVTLDHKGELYGLLVDKIGDVLDLARDLFEENPGTLGPQWREFSLGVFRLEKRLLVELDVDRFLEIRR